MRKTSIRSFMVSITLVVGVLVSLSASAAEDTKGTWIVRAGAASVNPNDSSGEVTGIPGSGAGVDDNLQLGLTGTYMVTNNIGIGVLAATPFEHDISGEGSLAGLGKIAEIKHLPPTLTLQYHFTNGPKAKPYVGAGLNYTVFFDEKASPSLIGALGAPTDVDLDESFGFALEAGVDIGLASGWDLNLAAWYIDIATTATLTAGGAALSVDVDVDPLVWMIGIGKTF